MIVAVPQCCVSPIFLVSKLLKDLTNLIGLEPCLKREANKLDVLKFSQLTPTSCNPINRFTAKSVLERVNGPRPDACFQLLTSVRWDSYSKITISPTRGRDEFESSLRPASMLSILYP